MLGGIKIANRTGIVLYYSAWIAGVNYSEDDNDENDFENESGNDEDNDTESSDVLTEDGYLIENIYPNKLGDILEDPSYIVREEYQDEPRRQYRGSSVEQVEIKETPGVIPNNSEPEHEIVFEYNKYDHYIEPLLNDLKYEESNTDSWNVLDDTEIDTKVDIKKPSVTIFGRVFRIQ